MAWPRVKDKMVKVDSDDTTRIGLLYPSIPFSLGLVVFLLRIPLACGTGLLTRSQAPEEEGAPLKNVSEMACKRGK